MFKILIYIKASLYFKSLCVDSEYKDMTAVLMKHWNKYPIYMWTKNAPSYLIHVWNNKKWIFYSSPQLSVYNGIFKSGFHMWENVLGRKISLLLKISINIYILTWQIFLTDVSKGGPIYTSSWSEKRYVIGFIDKNERDIGNWDV